MESTPEVSRAIAEMVHNAHQVRESCEHANPQLGAMLFRGGLSALLESIGTTHDLEGQLEQFIGLHPMAPDPVAGVPGASYHEVAMGLAKLVAEVATEALRVDPDPGPQGNLFDRLGDRWPTVREYVRARITTFDGPGLVARIRDEAARAARQANGLDLQPGNAKCSSGELAEKYGVDSAALRKRLDRWRYYHDTGYIEVSNPANNEPRYLYDESAVAPVIDSLKAKSDARKRAADGQRKNK